MIEKCWNLSPSTPFQILQKHGFSMHWYGSTLSNRKYYLLICEFRSKCLRKKWKHVLLFWSQSEWRQDQPLGVRKSTKQRSFSCFSYDFEIWKKLIYMYNLCKRSPTRFIYTTPSTTFNGIFENWQFLPPTIEVWGKVIFLHLYVSHSVHRGEVYPSIQWGCTPPGQIPPPEWQLKQTVRILLNAFLLSSRLLPI